MKLLVCTQAVDRDDPVLGFFHRWLAEFAKQAERVTVVCLFEGIHELPANVRVLSLGKETRRSRAQYLRRFFTYLWRERGEYDRVFVHMNEEYVLLGGLVWRMLGKRIALWRNHYAGSWKTRLAGLFAHRVLYTSGKSYTAKFRNAVQMPVGIDTERFCRDAGIARPDSSILFLGRVAPIKRLETVVEAFRLLSDRREQFVLDVYGDALPIHREYFDTVRARAAVLERNKRVVFHDGVPNRHTPEVYNAHAMFINITQSGSFDKTILEAMACECAVLVANDALRGVVSDECTLTGTDAVEIADKIVALRALPAREREERARRGRAYVEREHSLGLLAERLAEILR